MYKIATNQLDPRGHCAKALRATKLVRIAKKTSGIHPMATGETLRRIAGRFAVKMKKDKTHDCLICPCVSVSSVTRVDYTSVTVRNYPSVTNPSAWQRG